MTRRTIAGFIALPTLVVLWIAGLIVPVPFVLRTPGLTVDVLGQTDDGSEIVQVSGAKSYRDTDGQLRMTTVYITQPEQRVSLIQAVSTWLNPHDAVIPYADEYPPDITPEENQTQSAQQMTSSQDSAEAAALNELGYAVTRIRVGEVAPGSPAEGKLLAGDLIEAINGQRVTGSSQVQQAVIDTGTTKDVTFQVRRSGKTLAVRLRPTTIEGQTRVGFSMSESYDMPFTVNVAPPDGIGGPSAGLMFSLAIWDTLTPGSLAKGNIIAGTGMIDAEGNVGPIGGIQQKIPGAEQDGAQLFLVPADNCAEALLANTDGTIRLVKATTLKDAITSIEQWTANHDAQLPSCEEGS